MNVFYVILLSVFSLIVLFLLTKLIGCRQLSELSMFDYISGITIGNIAAEMATCPDKTFVEPLTAMIVYGLLTAFFAWLTGKSVRLRRFLSGSPCILFHNGKLYKGNFKKCRIDLSEFLVQCRLNGYFDLSQLQSAILEENGRISFLSRSADRPATPSDLSLAPEEETICPTYIMDGEILTENLQHSGKDEKWLYAQLAAHGCTDPSEVFLAAGNQNNTLNVYLKNNLKGSGVILE